MHLRWEEALESARGDVQVAMGTSKDDSGLEAGFTGAPSYTTPAPQRRPMSAQVYGSRRSRVQSYMTPHSLRLAQSRFQKAGLSRAQQHEHYAQMMHAEAMTKKGLRDIKARVAKADREVQESRHSTFKPDILQKSKRLVRSPDQKIYNRAAALNSVRTEKLKIARVEQVNREMAECTFTPRTGSGQKSRKMLEDVSLSFLERVDAALYLKRLKQIESQQSEAPRSVALRDENHETVFDRLTRRGKIIRDTRSARVGAMPTSGVPRGAWEMGLRGESNGGGHATLVVAPEHGAGYSVEEALYMDFLMREMKAEEREHLLHKQRREMCSSPKMSATSARYALNRAKRDIKNTLAMEIGTSCSVGPEQMYRVMQRLNLLDSRDSPLEVSGRHSVRKKKQKATADRLWRCLATLADLDESDTEVPLDLFVDFLVTLEEKAVGITAGEPQWAGQECDPRSNEMSTDILMQIMKELLAFRRLNRSNRTASRAAATPKKTAAQNHQARTCAAQTPSNVTFVRDELHQTNPYHKSQAVQEWVCKERLRKIETEMSECTFSPRINTSPRKKKVESLKKKIVQRASSEALTTLDLPGQGVEALAPAESHHTPSPRSAGVTPVSRPSFTPTPHKRAERSVQESQPANKTDPCSSPGKADALDSAENAPGNIKLYIDIDIGNDCSKRIAIAQGDDPSRLAEEFCREYRLGDQVVQILRNSLKRKMTAHALA